MFNLYLPLTEYNSTLLNPVFPNRIVKLSSSKLNYLIIAGAIIMYVSVILYVTPATSKIIETVICNVRPRVFSFGYSVCFGTILAKMWRVYYIFSNPGLKRKV